MATQLRTHRTLAEDLISCSVSKSSGSQQPVTQFQGIHVSVLHRHRQPWLPIYLQRHVHILYNSKNLIFKRRKKQNIWKSWAIFQKSRNKDIEFLACPCAVF